MDCVNHPGTPAESYCQKCGKALCSLCINRDQVVVLCSSCSERTSTEGRSGWSVDTRYSQQAERPTSRFLTWGYIGAVTLLAVNLVFIVFNSFALPYLGWDSQTYVAFNFVTVWAVFFPLSILIASGYWGLRVKYSESFLAAGALATVGRIPALWAVVLFPWMYWTIELYFLYTTGLDLAVAVLVILGLLFIKQRSTRPGLLVAVVGFMVVNLVLLAIRDAIAYLGLYGVLFLPALGNLSTALSLAGDLALVLFFNAERQTASVR